MSNISTNGAPAGGPLAGIRILDMTSVIMGPYSTQILGDYGAEVIKIESPGGDTTRKVPPMRNSDMGCFYLHSNRNKRSVVLDLKQPAALKAFMKLVETADALVSNVRPKAMARLGISYEALAKVNPRIIILSLVGFGQKGPYAAQPAYDDLIQGLTAVPSMLVEAGSEKPHYVPLAFNDRAVGLHGAIALTAALYRREQTGVGQAIEVPMFETMVQSTYGDHMGGLTFVPPKGPPGYKRQLNKERRPYATQDGYVCVIIYTDKHWRGFASLAGQPDLLERDPRFRDIGARTVHAEAVYEFVGRVMGSRTTAGWVDVLLEADIPVAPLHTLDTVLHDPHLTATGFIQDVEHPSEGPLKQIGIPATFSESPGTIRRHAPRLGEQTVEVLREAGLDEAEIDRLLTAGAAVQAD